MSTRDRPQEESRRRRPSSDLPNVVIVVARCCRERQLFGIRFEEHGRGAWEADWAFPLKERAAKREGYGSEISGSFEFAPDYPGCPGCRAPGLFVCSCGKVCCWDRVTRQVTCAWCGVTGYLNATVDHLNAANDG
jgi:hypothetical protein